MKNQLKEPAGQFTFKNKIYNVYKDTKSGLEFFFVGKEEKKFWSLLHKHKNPEAIPENELLSGIYFHKGTRNCAPNYVNSHVPAKFVRKG